jgi:hypothetical protein
MSKDKLRIQMLRETRIKIFFRRVSILLLVVILRSIRKIRLLKSHRSKKKLRLFKSLKSIY